MAKISANFGCFLKHNAIAPYNDAMSDYLDHLIQLERGKVSVGGDRSRLKWLDNMKSMYEEEVNILERAIKDQTSNAHVPTVEDIKRLYDSLCLLKISGPMLTDTMKVAEASGDAAMQYSEKRIPARRRQSDFRNYAVPPNYGSTVRQPQRGVGWRIIGGILDHIQKPPWR